MRDLDVRKLDVGELDVGELVCRGEGEVIYTQGCRSLPEMDDRECKANEQYQGIKRENRHWE